MIEKNQPAVHFFSYNQAAKKNVAQQLLKQNQIIAKYDKLDAQLQNMVFELQQMSVN